MRARRLVMVLACTAMTACHGSSSASEPHDRASSCTRLPLVGALAGRSLNAFQEKGRPSSDQRFTLATGLDPSRRTLLNVLQRPRDDSVALRELVWVDRRCRLTVWFRQTTTGWRAIHAVRTPAEAES